MENNFKELDFLDEKLRNINLEMLSLEKEKNKIEETKANLTQEIKDLEEEKKAILTKTDKYTGLKKYFYMLVQANSDLKNLKIINTKLEENRIKLQEVENKVDIKNQLIKEKLQDKLDVWNRREEIYVSKYMEEEKQSENTTDYRVDAIKDIDKEKTTEKGEQERDLKRLITLFNLVNTIDFENKKTNKIKQELVKGLNSNIEKYLKENNIKPPESKKTKSKKMEVENEC